MAGRKTRSTPRTTRQNLTPTPVAAQFSVGKYSSIDTNGQFQDPIRDASSTQAKVRMAQKQAGMSKMADLWAGESGNANIADSQNIGYYSYEFPVDAPELPQSRAQELRFYRLAYDRDPIVGRGIDLHTEIPMSKINLERPKCSSEAFADYVFDFFQGVVTNTRLFDSLLHAGREYWNIGEAFLFVEDDPNIEPCKAAGEFVQAMNEDDDQKMAEQGGSRSYFETDNASWGAGSIGMKSSANKLAAKLGFNPLAAQDKVILKKVAALTQVLADLKTLQTRKVALDPPGAPVVTDAAPKRHPAGTPVPTLVVVPSFQNPAWTNLAARWAAKTNWVAVVSIPAALVVAVVLAVAVWASTTVAPASIPTWSPRRTPRPFRWRRSSSS